MTRAMAMMVNDTVLTRVMAMMVNDIPMAMMVNDTCHGNDGK